MTEQRKLRFGIKANEASMQQLLKIVEESDEVGQYCYKDSHLVVQYRKKHTLRDFTKLTSIVRDAEYEIPTGNKKLSNEFPFHKVRNKDFIEEEDAFTTLKALIFQGNSYNDLRLQF